MEKTRYDELIKGHNLKRKALLYIKSVINESSYDEQNGFIINGIPLKTTSKTLKYLEDEGTLKEEEAVFFLRRLFLEDGRKGGKKNE